MGHERLFDYEFDFQAYIENRLREFDDLEERKFAKAILQDGLMNIMKETESKYAALEKRVYDEINDETGKYEIRTTVIKKADYDPTNPTWFPVIEEDLSFNMIRDYQLWEAIEAKESCTVSTHIFIEANDLICHEISQSGEIFHGKIFTDKGSIAANFQLKKCEKYAKRVEFLYELFQANQISWVTVNRALLDKFFEIHFIGMGEEIPKGAQWTGIEIDYGKYKELISADMIPVWNVQRISYNSDEFPIPCIDNINYEHEFPMKDFGIENGFLLEQGAVISSIRFENERIIVATPMETFSRWIAYKIVSAKQVRSLGYSYPVLSNHKKSNFTKNYIKSKGTRLKTKADLFRRMNEIDIEAFIRFKDCEIIEAVIDSSPFSDMDDFIKDEIFDCKSKRVLLLKFEAEDASHYLNDAIVRFAVSEIQLEESEYRCKGVLI